MEFYVGLMIGMHLVHFFEDSIENFFISMGLLDETKLELIHRIEVLEEGICGELKK